MITHFEHFLSFLADNNLNENAAQWAKAGFLTCPTYTRHDPGLENGFVMLTGTYLEFLSVADESKFKTTKWEPYIQTRSDPRINGPCSDREGGP